MSYVPPHKRRSRPDKKNISEAPRRNSGIEVKDEQSSTSASAASSWRNNRFNIDKNVVPWNKDVSDRDDRTHGTNSRDDTSAGTSANANRTFFCEAFSFIRCINLARRPEQWNRFLYHGGRIGSEFVNKVERFDAVDGKEAALLEQGDGSMPSVAAFAADDSGAEKPHNTSRPDRGRVGIDVAWEWETTKNSSWDRHVAPRTVRQLTPGEIGCALSHVALWKDLATANQKEDPEGSLSMLIFEDDAAFLKPGGRNRLRKPNHESSADRFLRAFRRAHKLLPTDWDIFYLGFSDRGERNDLICSSGSGREGGSLSKQTEENDADDLVVHLFRPTYGFHTHAYAIRRSAAKQLVENCLPVVGPIDVWLADNQWFGLSVYCAIVANEGWKNTGAPLVGQDRSVAVASSVGHSGR